MVKPLTWQKHVLMLFIHKYYCLSFWGIAAVNTDVEQLQKMKFNKIRTYAILFQIAQ